MVKVLVVDDDSFMCQLMRRIAKMLDCDAYEALSGSNAEAQAPELNPDIILLDIMMPDQDGFETCKHLRAAGYSGLILMVSALQAGSQQEKLQEAGADGYIQKPLTRMTLEPYVQRFKVAQ